MAEAVGKISFTQIVAEFGIEGLSHFPVGHILLAHVFSSLPCDRNHTECLSDVPMPGPALDLLNFKVHQRDLGF